MEEIMVDSYESIEYELTKQFFKYESLVKVDNVFESMTGLPGKSISKFDNSVIGIIEGIYFIPESYSTNKRYYSLSFWNEVLNSKRVQNDLKLGRMLGIFEHPEILKYENKDGQSTMSHPMNAGIVTKELKIVKLAVPYASKTNPGVPVRYVGLGKAYVLNTQMGNLINIFMNARDENGLPLIDISISSRGYNLAKNKVENGIEIMEAAKYYLKAFDVTLTPGIQDTAISLKPFESKTESDLSNETQSPMYESVTDCYSKLRNKCHCMCDIKKSFIEELGLKSSITKFNPEKIDYDIGGLK